MISTEEHWDNGAPFGTVKPLKYLGISMDHEKIDIGLLRKIENERKDEALNLIRSLIEAENPGLFKKK